MVNISDKCTPWQGNGVYTLDGKQNGKNRYLYGDYSLVWNESQLPEIKHWYLIDSSGEPVAWSRGKDFSIENPSEISNKCPPEIEATTPHWVDENGCADVTIYVDSGSFDSSQTETQGTVTDTASSGDTSDTGSGSITYDYGGSSSSGSSY